MNTRLRLAINNDNVNDVRQCILQGADLDKKDGELDTPIMCAVQSGRTACLRELFGSRRDVAQRTFRGDSPLVKAAEEEHIDHSNAR